MRLDYRNETFSKVSVCGVECGFNDMRIERSSVPEEKYLYEVAGDDDSGGDPARIQQGVLANFFGTLVCDNPLPIGDDDVLWLADGDFVWM